MSEQPDAEIRNSKTTLQRIFLSIISVLWEVEILGKWNLMTKNYTNHTLRELETKLVELNLLWGPLKHKMQ